LTVAELRGFLEHLDDDLEVAVLKPRGDLNEDHYPPELFKITSILINKDWHMLDLRVEKVLSGE